MTIDDSDADLDERLREARARLSAPGTGPRPESRGESSDADGWMRVVAVDGRLDEIVLNPRVLRWEMPELTERLVTAINAAFGEARTGAPDADEPVIDPAVLAGRLREVQDEGMQMMALIGQGLDEAITKIRERASVPGAPATPAVFDALLERTREMAAAAAPSDVPVPEEVTGVGRDPSAQVVAVAGAGERLESLEIGSRALRAGSEGLAEAVVAAVNAALDDLGDGGTAQATTMDRAELLGRAQEIQDLTLEQMRTFTRSLSSMMAGISPDQRPEK
ncbi:hypothetical protein [Actinomadura sp. 3N508]|uniref:hypothetical protein n=1 Tax=Actinomadura sp. 3N508 TaxID=3375153 RepID=UPI00379722D5